MTISATTQGLKPGVCTSTNRPANPYDGMVIYETDTDKVAVYDSSAWVYKTGTTAPITPGIQLLTTASNSAASTITVDSIFTSGFRNYLFVASGAFGNDNTSLSLGLRTSGSTNSSGSYIYSSIENTSAAGPTRIYVTNGTSFDMGFGGNLTGNINILFMAPQVATASHVKIETQGWGSSTAGATWTMGSFNTTTQFDGFVITPSAGTITSSYSIYGYGN